jgi:hypothetical protein
MKKYLCLQRIRILLTAISFAVYFVACSGSNSLYWDAFISAGGTCKIDFQPGVKDWSWNPVNIVNDNTAYIFGGFGPPMWQGTPAKEVESYGFAIHTEWLNVRCAKPAQDGVSLNDIWTAYNAKSTDPADGSILTTAFGLCVVDYNWSKINSVPYGDATVKHLHKFRIIAKSKPLGGGKYQDSILLTVYANSNYPNSNDPEQLNISMNDTDIEAVQIGREIQ